MAHIEMETKGRRAFVTLVDDSGRKYRDALVLTFTGPAEEYRPELEALARPLDHSEANDLEEIGDFIERAEEHFDGLDYDGTGHFFANIERLFERYDWPEEEGEEA